MKFHSLVAVTLQCLVGSINGKPIKSRQSSSCSFSDSKNTFPTSFTLQAIDTSTNASMTLAPVNNISFDEPGTLYLGGNPDFTFSLSNYTLSIGDAPCSLPTDGETSSLGYIHCSVKVGARLGGNPYFSIGCNQDLGILVLEVAYPSAGSVCESFGTDNWAQLGEVYMSLGACGQFPTGYDSLLVQVIPVNATQT